MFKFLVLCLCVFHTNAINDIKETKVQYSHQCASNALDPAMILLKEPQPIIFETVTLLNCKPPITGSYANALASRNILIGSYLEIHYLPPDTKLTAAAFADLPTSVHYVAVSASEELVADPDTFSSLDNIRHISLIGVRAEHLPKNLNKVQLSVGYERIPMEALNAQQITITSYKPVTFIGTAQRLKTLDVYGDMVNLLQEPGQNEEPLRAPVLDALLISRMTTIPSPTALSIGEMYSSIRGVTITEVNWKEIPRGLFRGASRLRQVSIQHTNVTQLSEELFSYSPNLKVVNLDYNKLESLPCSLFLSQTNLISLSLQGNRLRADDMTYLLPLVALTDLNLSENPLGDLCARGGSNLLALQNLTSIRLSKTDAVHICRFWLQQIPALTKVDLENNLIGSVACADLRGAVGDHQPVVVHLAGNPVETAECSRIDIDRDDKHSEKLKQIRLQGVSPLKCDCGSYWLSRWLQLKVNVVYSPKYIGSSECNNDWTICSTLSGPVSSTMEAKSKDYLKLRHIRETHVFRLSFEMEDELE